MGQRPRLYIRSAQIHVSQDETHEQTNLSIMGKHKSAKSKNKNEQIVIDEKNGLIFNNEDELYQHFSKEITALEKEFFDLRPDGDISDDDFEKYEENLSVALEDPDEVWEDEETLEGVKLTIYLRKFPHPTDSETRLYHVAIVYMADDLPSFVYLHFPTQIETLVGQYRRGKKIFDRLDQKIPFGALEGDALHEGDEFARGLYQAMLKVRADNDIPEDKFRSYAYMREETIEQPDEIWRNNDTLGNILVSFVREFPDEAGGKDTYYVVVTIEDTPSNSHALLFSFPTNDETLVARYRHGENLQAEEVTQEASH